MIVKKHQKNNILFNEFDKTQYIDKSIIICDNCKKVNKNSSFQNQIFICITCKLIYTLSVKVYTINIMVYFIIIKNIIYAFYIMKNIIHMAIFAELIFD